MVGENPPADSKTAGRRSSFSAVESRLTRMILRNSLGSVPSTALLAKATSSLSNWSSCLRGAEKMCPRLLKAASTVGSGNCSSTAPMVPPKTIMAAVGCRIWPRFPPSISNPAMMPARARMTPPTLPLSMEQLLYESCAENQVRRADFLCHRSASGSRRVGAGAGWEGLERSRLARETIRCRSP